VYTVIVFHDGRNDYLEQALTTFDEQVAFPEHVFYRFDEWRIVEVWSVIDKEAIREQISPQCSG